MDQQIDAGQVGRECLGVGFLVVEGCALYDSLVVRLGHARECGCVWKNAGWRVTVAVSYTHLTLPTKA